MKLKNFKTLVLMLSASALVVLTGCGDEGIPSGIGMGVTPPSEVPPVVTPPANTAPVANAGADQNVSTGSDVTLEGSGSSDADGDTLTYAWTLTAPTDSTAALSDATTVTPAFIADVEGNYTVELVVNDGTDDSVADSMTVVSTDISHNGTAYRVVTSPKTGKVWLDRNLGASQVCTSLTDTACYGDYYQWGREADGHESKTSATTDVLADTIASVGSLFIINDGDWTTADVDRSQRSTSWSKTDGTSICPLGFRVPTSIEWNAEFDLGTEEGWDGTATKTIAFDSFLKLGAAGQRNWDSVMQSEGSDIFLYASDLSIDSRPYGAWITDVDSAYFSKSQPADAYSIRCIMN